MKRIRNYNQTAYDEAVRLALEQQTNAKKLSEAITVFKSDNFEEINKSLEKQTGFKNSKMSAELMNVSNEYNTILKHLGSINLSDYTSDFKDLTQAKKDDLKQQYTTYWKKEETMLLEKVEKLVKGLNDMSYPVKKSLMVNRFGEVRFDEKQFNYHYQMSKINNTSLGKV
mgnify:FL=1